MTLYRLYQQNGNRPGFWVQHRTWGNTCGRVTSISGESGAVVMELFDIRSGRVLAHADERSRQLELEDDAPAEASPLPPPKPDSFDRQYTSIAEPFWHVNGRAQA